VDVREATAEDAVAISNVAVRARRQANAKDYDPEIIEAIVGNFSPDGIATRMRDRLVFVAVAGEEILGTAGLDGSTVRSVFVRPDWHRNGIGAALMCKIEESAILQGVHRLAEPSSVTAEGFYRQLGFASVRDEFHGNERTIVMTKQLVPIQSVGPRICGSD
jgi:GNAT superfamily N-acetyltransferase